MQNIRSKGEENHQKHAEGNARQCGSERKDKHETRKYTTEHMDKNEMTMQLEIKV